MTREFLKSQLRRISALWPLQASTEVLDEYSRILWGFTESEIAAGFDHVIDTHTEMAAPKPGHIRSAVGQVAKARRNIAPPEAERVAAGEPIPIASDLAAIGRWALDHAPEVDAQIDALISSWDTAAQQQYRHVMRATASRLCYERANPRLRVLP
jgi:hypothetical protein